MLLSQLAWEILLSLSNLRLNFLPVEGLTLKLFWIALQDYRPSAFQLAIVDRDCFEFPFYVGFWINF